MINYAVRDSWAFDFIWWKFLDERCFGPSDNQDYHARLYLPLAVQKAVIDTLVIDKADERSHRRVVEWDNDLAAARVDEPLAL